MTENRKAGFTKEDIDRLQFYDNREYQARFLLDPALIADADFSHLDKNLAITNFIYNARQKVDESQQARSILRGLHVLNNPKHYDFEYKSVLSEYREERVNGNIIQTPVYVIQKVAVPKFPKTFHNMRSEFISFVNTASASSGHRIKRAITNRLVK